jgi:hypothetical protein
MPCAGKLGEPEMHNDLDTNPIKLRCAPNGKLYAVCHGQPVYTSEGSLRYFMTERDAWAFLAESGVEEHSDTFAEERLGQGHPTICAAPTMPKTSISRTTWSVKSRSR